MEYESVLSILDLNTDEVAVEAVRLLIKIAQNILADPSNVKIRTLLKSNKSISSKIIQAKGAVECLSLMGFVESDSKLYLPEDTNLEGVEIVKNYLLAWVPAKQRKTNANRTIKKIVLPPFVPISSNPFLQNIENVFHMALQYEAPGLQERARLLIPVSQLEHQATTKVREAQKSIKKNKLEDPEVTIQDFLIIELLTWFKQDFFTWMDSPPCDKCQGPTRMSHMSNDPKLLVYTKRVEMHLCSECNIFTAFPRYNDLNILLETRKGRCGEWANTFTLLCRAMNWDARYVVDETDHVWTEVYSIAQKRWLHCDPCETICDTPLVYETGWKKQLTYVLAYSAEEIQDVTWRYTANFRVVREKRKKCSEEELTRTLLDLRAKRYNFLELTPARRQYLTLRTCLELAELCLEKRPNIQDQQGRTSGSLMWRLMRGETEEIKSVSYVWNIEEGDIVNDCVVVKYSSVLDRYQYVSGDKTISEIYNWNQGAFHHKNIFRKVENDWNVVYLSRKEQASTGIISWKFTTTCETKQVSEIQINFNSKTFEDGKVEIQISSDDSSVVIPEGEMPFISDKFSGEKSFTITASLSGGKGDVAWQHAQLFRQNLHSEDFDFVLKITFQNIDVNE